MTLNKTQSNIIKALRARTFVNIDTLARNLKGVRYTGNYPTASVRRDIQTLRTFGYNIITNGKGKYTLVRQF